MTEHEEMFSNKGIKINAGIFSICNNTKEKQIMKGIKMNKQTDKNNDNNNKEKNKKKYIDTIILDAIKNAFKKDTIKNIFKNDKIVFLTNIVTYIMFAIIVYLMQNSIVQEIKLGQRNNTCK